MAFLSCLALALGGLAGACDDGGSAGAGGGSLGSADAGCALGPEPLFTITVRAADGPLPPDTTIVVTWSAGQEPAFHLDEPGSWNTLEQANLVCRVDATKPPPTDLEALVCELWTSGATNVEVVAQAHERFEATLSPAKSEDCEGFVPSEVAIELEPEVDEPSR